MGRILLFRRPLGRGWPNLKKESLPREVLLEHGAFRRRARGMATPDNP